MRFLRGLKDIFVPSARNSYRPHVLRRPPLIIFLALVLASEGFLVSNLIARQSGENFLAAVVPGEIIALTNQERATSNDGSLLENSQLDAAAQAKADSMAKYDYFAHVGPDGKTPWQWVSGAGYQYQYAGENLAVRFVDSADVLNAWMASPTHRANIVKAVYTEIGVGVAQGMYQGEPATYVVQYFGTPLAVADIQQVQTTQAPAQEPPPAPIGSSQRSLQGIPAPSAPVSENVTPKVAGAESQGAAISGASLTQSFTRQLMRALSEPSNVTNTILGAIAAILVIALAMTFFVHLHIQPGNMLASGAVVAAFALFFLAINAHLWGGPLAGNQAAAVGQYQGVVINQSAAETGYALFPQ